MTSITFEKTMLKSFIFVFVVIVIPASLISQTLPCGTNLVPNPSFENYSSCPPPSASLETYCDNWLEAQTTCDYFNSCGTLYNGTGLTARTGDGYAGFSVYRIMFGQTPYQHLKYKILRGIF